MLTIEGILLTITKRNNDGRNEIIKVERERDVLLIEYHITVITNKSIMGRQTQPLIDHRTNNKSLILFRNAVDPPMCELIMVN